MVKGVSKTIIEVNNTGSKFFEKIVFYVTPEYGTLNAKHLKKAAAEFAYCYNNSKSKKPLRKYYKRKKIITFLSIGVAFLGAVAASLIIIL
jgi:hypothetical protein